MSNHLSTPVNVAGRSHCQFCERKLPIINRLFGSGFCSVSHQSAYVHRQQEMFLARLHLHDRFVADRPIPSPALGASKVVAGEIEPIVFSSFIKC
jgi:hypothetical protein